VKVQAWREEDEPAARRIAEQLRADAISMADWEHVTITVRHANVSLRGEVNTYPERQAIILAVKQAGGFRAIYDELQVR
jgi:osmotically-inducible protein OsmY